MQLISPAPGLVVRVGGYADRPKSEKGGGDGFEGLRGDGEIYTAAKGRETVGGIARKWRTRGRVAGTAGGA